MRIKLRYKLFIVFLITSLMVLGLIVVKRYYAFLTFADYINKVELAKLGELKEWLMTEYKEQQGWESLKSNPRRWRAILIATFLDMAPSPPPPSSLEPAPPPPHTDDPFRIGPRVALFDEQKDLIAGNPAPFEAEALEPIQVDGETVGWIGIRKREHLSSPLELAFLEQQYRLFYLLGIGILALVALVSFLLSRHILVPIKELMDGTEALVSRQFKTRIRVRSSDELGQLASNFNVMAQHLEKYEEMRQQWISDISHELRTPLSILRGEIEALQDGVREVSGQTLGSLHSEVMRLSKLVDDLHQLSLAESQGIALRKDPVKPLHLLEETLRSFRTRLGTRKINVALDLGEDGHATIAGDPERLGQLFCNILENTLRYADSPGTLRIWANHGRERLMIYFEDSGPGVPKESLGRLFDRLYRVDRSRSRALGGSGLGLAICRQIVEGHGGEISAANSALGGLRIKIAFPRILN